MSRNKVNQTDGSLTMVAGRGKAEYGASTVRKGNTGFAAGAVSVGVGQVNVTFDTPMPDANYEVVLTITSLNAPDGKFEYGITGKTTTGFTIWAIGSDTTSTNSNPISMEYTAFKLYTDTEYNEVLERTDANDLGTSVNILSYDSTSNKYTFPSDGYLSLNPTAHSGNKIGAVIYGATENTPYLVAYCDSASANATFVKKGMRAIINIKEGTDLIANFIPLS